MRPDTFTFPVAGSDLTLDRITLRSRLVGYTVAVVSPQRLRCAYVCYTLLAGCLCGFLPVGGCLATRLIPPTKRTHHHGCSSFYCDTGPGYVAPLLIVPLPDILRTLRCTPIVTGQPTHLPALPHIRPD